MRKKWSSTRSKKKRALWKTKCKKKEKIRGCKKKKILKKEGGGVDSLEDYKKGGREDLVKQIDEEIAIISEYLPKQLSKEEVAEIVKQVIAEVGATSIKDMGKVMKSAKEKIGAASDGKTINEVVKEQLN